MLGKVSTIRDLLRIPTKLFYLVKKDLPNYLGWVNENVTIYIKKQNSDYIGYRVCVRNEFDRHGSLTEKKVETIVFVKSKLKIIALIKCFLENRKLKSKGFEFPSDDDFQSL